MTLLDNRVSKLCSGYDEVIDAHIHIKKTWRDRLLIAYAQKRVRYEKARKEYLKRHQEIKKQATKSLALIAALFILGIIAIFIDAWVLRNGFGTAIGLLLMGAGFLIGLNLALKWSRHKSQCPQFPSDPLQAGFIPPLLPVWKRELKGQLPYKMEYDGAEGEYAFVHQLQRNLDSSHYIVYRLQQKQGDDVDVTLVGPSGVWVFEVKYWSGSVMWQNGQWHRQKTYYEKGGVPVTKNNVVKQSPDDQWRRMAGDVAKSIQIHAPQLVSRFLAGIRTQGGIVFTQPSATYQIAPSCPFAWGDTSNWTRKIMSAPRISGWDERTTFIVLDALFTRHHQVVATNSVKSLHAVGTRLIQQTEKELATWIAS